MDATSDGARSRWRPTIASGPTLIACSRRAIRLARPFELGIRRPASSYPAPPRPATLGTCCSKRPWTVGSEWAMTLSVVGRDAVAAPRPASGRAADSAAGSARCRRARRRPAGARNLPAERGALVDVGRLCDELRRRIFGWPQQQHVLRRRPWQVPLLREPLSHDLSSRRSSGASVLHGHDLLALEHLHHVLEPLIRRQRLELLGRQVDSRPRWLAPSCER